MIPAPVRYHRALSLEDAFEALAEDEAKALAGGQSLVPVLKLRVARPSLVVDIGGLGLRGLTAGEGEVRIGALTTWAELEEAVELRAPGLAAVSECARGIGDLQVRNRGTLGGSLAHADPASDMPAVLLALGARLRLRSRGGERDVPLSQFFVGPFLTVLESGELIVEIVVPVPPPGSGSAYASVEHPASGFALAGVAAFVHPEGETLAATGLGAHPFTLPAGDPREALSSTEIFGDRFAPAEYRRELAAVLAERALSAARKHAREAS